MQPYIVITIVSYCIHAVFVFSGSYIYYRSLTYRSEDRDVSVIYTQGCWVGRLGSDIVRFVDGPNASARVEVASILSSEQFFINGSMWEGILGLAYARLSKVHLFNKTNYYC